MHRSFLLTAIRLALLSLPITTTSSAVASPGSPPPEYIVAAATHLVPTQTIGTFDRYAATLAGDVTVWFNGEAIASDKAGWLAQERRRLGKVDRRVLGHADGLESILVLDQVDDRSDLPYDPRFHFDARYQTRAVRYQFGADHLVHAIRIVSTDGFLQVPS